MSVELELAVVRGREYLARAVFRPDVDVSLGANPRATVSLAEPELPEHMDFVRLGNAGATLRFDRASKVELQVGGAMLATAQLLTRGLARETADGFEAELQPGSRGVVHFGALRVLLKVQAPRQATVWSAAGEDRVLCGGCGSPLPWAVAGPGALTPCRVCGDLNRLESRGEMFEVGATALVPKLGPEGTTYETEAPTEPDPQPLYGPTRPLPIQVAAAVSRIDANAPAKGSDLPTFDAIQAKKSADLPTYDGIRAPKGSDLPTFDAIEVQRAKSFEDEQTVPPDTRSPSAAPQPGKGADLPTFDAISVIKRDQVLNTQSAIQAMKKPGGKPQAPNLAAKAPPKLPEGMQLQPTGAVPIAMNTGDIEVPSLKKPVRLGAEPTPVLVPKEATDEARERIDRWDRHALAPNKVEQYKEIAPTDISFDQLPSAQQSVSGNIAKPVLSRKKKLPSEAEVLPGGTSPKMAAPSEEELDRHAQKAPVPETRAQMPSGTTRPSPRAAPPDATEEGDYDDFLMGDHDGGIGTRDHAGWFLIGFGVISGIVGMGLILYVLLR